MSVDRLWRDLLKQLRANDQAWEAEARACHKLLFEKDAEIEQLRTRQRHAISWLRQNAGTETKARAAFAEAHNAVLGIIEGRFDAEPAGKEG